MKKLLLSFFLSLFMILLFTACDNSQIATNNSEFINEEQPTLYVLKTYSLTDEYGNAGTYTEINGQYNKGDAVELEATVNPGYNFEGWYINDIRVSDKLLYSFTMKAENLNLEARWSYYTVTVNSDTDEQGTAGTFTKKVDEKISAGETVTLTATVADGYNFEGWYINGVCVCSDLTYQFVMEKVNKKIRAEYSYYTLTTKGFSWKHASGSYFDNGIVGTYTKYNQTKISVGKVVTLIATVNDGYTFNGWYIRNVCVSTELGYLYTMQNDDVEIIAKYTYYTISTKARVVHGNTSGILTDNVGTYTQYDEEKIRVGDTVTLAATVKTGYKFVGWKCRNTIVCEDLTYTFVMGTSDETYEAVFEEL